MSDCPDRPKINGSLSTETRVALHDQRINIFESTFEKCQQECAESRRRIYEKAEDVSGRVGTLETEQEGMESQMQELKENFNSIKAWTMAVFGGLVVAISLLLIQLAVAGHTSGAVKP